tara:strand:+ start:500 stop:1159 length:660 start_codon:yes stop_codon:yes gene_type:complete
MKTHKVVLGTPRSGSSFITRWYSNEYPEYKALSEDKGFEHFEPDHPGWPMLGDQQGIDKETEARIKKLEDKTIWKMHPGPDMSKHIFDYISKIPVILVKRKDLLGQFISYGVGWATNKWVNFDPDSKSKNGLTEDFYYEKKWFDDLVFRLKDLEEKQKGLKIEKLIWFEDIPNFKVNGKLSVRQNDFSNEQKLKWLINSNEFMNWFLKFSNSFQMKETA